MAIATAIYSLRVKAGSSPRKHVLRLPRECVRTLLVVLAGEEDQDSLQRLMALTEGCIDTHFMTFTS